MSALASSSDPCSDWKALKTPIPGRRIWKKTKERTETIWPPLLETALVEALDKYRPAKSHRDTRLLRRFPKRNRFISDHIFSVTGTRRTAKQVGSRLQQMRDTCEDERILNLISRREYSEELDSDAAELALSSTASSPASWTSDVIDAVNCTAYSGLAAGPPPRTFVTIELVQPSSSSRSRIFTPVVAKSTRSNQQRISLEYPPEIANTGPMLTFTTPRRISTANHYSHFQVLIGGAVVHSEITALVLTPSATPASHIYSTELIPQFWAHLCRTAQLFQCVIKQDIMKTCTAFHVLPAAPGASDQSIRFVTYDFSGTPSPAPVFCPPSLETDPPLPPGFPRGVRPSPTQFSPPVEYPIMSTLPPGTMPTHPSPAKFTPNDELSAYHGWHLAEATTNSFHDTSFNDSYACVTEMIPASYSNSSYFQSPASGATDLNQWYDTTHINIASPSPIAYYPHVYSAYNSNSL